MKDVKIDKVEVNAFKSILNEAGNKFVKVDDIQPGQHGYNIRVKILSVNFEKNEN